MVFAVVVSWLMGTIRRWGDRVLNSGFRRHRSID
jgi:hypothetical protein